MKEPSVVANVQGHLIGQEIILTGVASNNLIIIISGENNWQGKTGKSLLNRAIFQFLLIHEDFAN